MNMQQYWYLQGIPVPWDSEVCEVSVEQYCELAAELMTKYSLDDMPVEPKPPVKSRFRFFGMESVEFDNSSPVYLLKYKEYLEKMEAWRINETKKKNLAVYAPWGKVIFKIK